MADLAAIGTDASVFRACLTSGATLCSALSGPLRAICIATGSKTAGAWGCGWVVASTTVGYIAEVIGAKIGAIRTGLAFARAARGCAATNVPFARADTAAA